VCEELGTSCYVRKNTTSNKDHEEKKTMNVKKEKEIEERKNRMCYARKKKLRNVLAMFSIMKNKFNLQTSQK
jgi:hypothetical protein